MKKLLAVMLLMCMLLCTACKAKEDEQPAEGTNDQTQQTQSAAEESATTESVATIELAEHVARAMENSSLLVSEYSVYIPGVGIAVLSNFDDPFEDDYEIYSEMDVKSIVADPHGHLPANVAHVEKNVRYYSYALAQNGTVFCGDQIVANNIDSLIASEESVFAIDVNGELFQLNQKKADTFWRLRNQKTLFATSCFSGNWIIDEQYAVQYVPGNGYLSNEDSINRGDINVFNNQQMAMIAATEKDGYTEAGEWLTLVSLAGVTRDGRVIATGYLSEEITAWGELSTISMRDGIIAGLTPQGRIMLTGIDYDVSATAWDGIVGMKLFDNGVNAIDHNGTYYISCNNIELGYVSFNLDGFVSPVNNSNIYVKLYGVDGNTYMLYPEESHWIGYGREPANLRNISAPVSTPVPQPQQSADWSRAVPEAFATNYNALNMNNESFRSWVNDILGRRAGELDQQEYTFDIRYKNDIGYGQFGKIMGIEIHVNAAQVDYAFLKDVVLGIVESGMLNGLRTTWSASLEDVEFAADARGYREIGDWDFSYSNMGDYYRVGISYRWN